MNKSLKKGAVQKDDTPNAPGPHSQRRISSGSRFCDEFWILDESNHSKQVSGRRINWNAALDRDRCLTDPEFADLLHTCKLLIYYLKLGKAKHGTIKGASLVSMGGNLIRFVRWMVNRGYVSFSKLSVEDLIDYRDEVTMTRTRFDQKSGSVVPCRDAKRLHPRSISLRLSPIRYLVELSDLVGDAPDWDPYKDPLVEGPGSVSTNPIPRIPDDIAMVLYSESLRFIAEYGRELIRLKHEMRRAHLAAKRRWKNRDYRFRGQRAVLNSSTLVLSFGGRAIALDSIDTFEFNRLILLLETACYVVVAGFTGMRVSEMSGLTVRCLESDEREGVPILFLCSELIKTAPGESQPMRWVAGNDTPDNPIRVAVECIRDLWSEERCVSGVEFLFVARGQHKSREEIHSLSGSAINWRLGQLSAAFGLPDSWHLSTHQFRKTFARFVATFEVCALYALKHHFKHVSIQMTDLYVGTDYELFSLVLEAQEEHVRDLLDVALNSENLAGKLGEEISTNNVRFRGVAGMDVRSNYINDLIGNSSVSIVPNPYGFCVFRREKARCQGDRAMVGINTCIGCSNLIIGPQHLPYWNDRESMLVQFKESSIWLDDERLADVDEEISQARHFISIITGSGVER